MPTLPKQMLLVLTLLMQTPLSRSNTLARSDSAAYDDNPLSVLSNHDDSGKDNKESGEYHNPAQSPPTPPDAEHGRIPGV